MLHRRALLTTGALGAIAAATGLAGRADAAGQRFEFNLPDAEWRKRLSPTAYYVLREHGTERAGSSPLDGEKRRGTYSCAGCALPLFDSKTKFHSGTGWPSFYRPLPKAVMTVDDNSLGMRRVEVNCRRCGGHLGHVFNDGPAPTGLRYCMNGVSLSFRAA